MAFERHEGTVVALTEPILRETPFDGAPSRPVLLVNSERVVLRQDEVRALMRRLAAGPPSQGTVKLQTFGLDQIDALDDEAARGWFRQQREQGERAGWPSLRVEPIGGAIVFHGPPAHLRSTAAMLRFLQAPRADAEYGYRHVGAETATHHWPGEVQVFADYRAMLTDARLVRERSGGPQPGESPGLFSERLCAERARRSDLRAGQQKKKRSGQATRPDAERTRAAIRPRFSAL